ncbi:chymotrypsinogen B-like [Ixodes scapularis]|uniref:chymotrypsinogen B-like n=1 Tax=Ixodes scapularis TaxID=6945 RepID=UPI001A9E38A8|nr:chymotrypsinogen B-like [Ixodes scapularis]
MNPLFLVFVYTIALLYESAGLARKGEKDTQYKCGKRQKEKHVSARIINGTEALPDHWPWMVAIYNSNDTFVCGGVLIGEEHIVTATHCFRNQDAHEFSVRLGTTLQTNVSQCNTPQDSNIREKKTSNAEVSPELYEEYNEDPQIQVVCVEVESICAPIQDNCSLFMKDIAVVKLKTKVKYTDYIQPICLPKTCVDSPARNASYAAGWGRIYEYYNSFEYEDDPEVEENIDDHEIHKLINKTSSEVTGVESQTEQTNLVIFRNPKTLMERKLDLMDQTQCSAQMKSEVPGYIICTNGGTCGGDSGGPLMYEDNGRWTLIGVISDGPDDCFNPERPSLFVKVSHFMDSLISKFMKLGSDSDKNATCATEDARKECVTRFFQFYNMSVEPIYTSTVYKLNNVPVEP